MEYVEPIRNKTDIEVMKRILKKRNLRDYALFVLGINSGLRISDMLGLKIKDVTHASKRTRIADRIRIREQKTGKAKDFPINEPAKKALKEYLRRGNIRLDPGAPLFQSRKGKGEKAISRNQAYRVIRSAAHEAGVEEAIGTHTMRKTFGYHAYKAGVDLEVIQDILNHHSQGVTLRYIGIKREDRDSVYSTLRL